MRFFRRNGQTSTEYLLAISVVVIAVTMAAWPFYTEIDDGINAFVTDNFTYFFAQEGGPG